MTLNADILIRIILETAAAAFIAPAFAMLFTVPAKYLIFTALGGAVTRFFRSLFFLGLHMEIVMATFFACAIVSLLFIYIGPKLNVPRPVFTVASIIALIPGMDAYNALLSIMNLIEVKDINTLNEIIFTLLHSGARCGAILLAIALGIAVPPLFFYKYRHQRL